MLPLKDNLRCKVFPTATLVIIALNLLAWFYEIMVQGSGAASQFFATYAMTPGKVTEALSSADPHLMLWAAISLVTCMFLHGSWMHIIGNMLFLFAFGRGIEARMGRGWYVTFYLLSGFAASLLQIWSDPTSMIPNLGASGAIAGVLGGYLLFWPKARVLGIIPTLPFVVETWAALFLPGWIVLQFLSVLGPQTGGGGVAYWAHIGGFLGGVVLAAIWKLHQPESDVCYIPTDCECPTPSESSDEEDDEDEQK